MTKKVINVSIIGAGYMAEEYLKVLSASPRYNVIGIFSRNIKKCENLKKNYNSLEIFKNISDMYSFTKSQLLIIACSAESTKSVATEATKYPWTILFEKPIGLNFYEYEEISTICSNRDSNAYVALNRRYYSSTQKLILMLNEIDSPRYINIYDQEDIEKLKLNKKNEEVIKNWMYVNSIHLIDYIDILARGSLSELKITDRWNQKSPNLVTARLVFNSGDIVNYHAIWNAPAPWEVKIFTRKNFFNLRPIERLSYINESSRELKNVEIDDLDLKYKPGLYLLIEEMYKCLNGLSHKVPSIKQNKKTMNYIKDIYEV